MEYSRKKQGTMRVRTESVPRQRLIPDQVRTAAGGLEVLVTTDAGRIEQVIPEVEVILGGIGPDLLGKAPICAGPKPRPPVRRRTRIAVRRRRFLNRFRWHDAVA